MDNTISAQELKRRGIGAVDKALQVGPVHVIRRNRPQYVILSEADYQRLIGQRQSGASLWQRLLADTAAAATNGRSATDIREQVRRERQDWDTP